MDLSNKYYGKKIMITGGLGMMGSAIAHKLVKYGAVVTIVDSCMEPFGANLFNVEDIKNEVHINIADIRDKEAIKFLIKDKDIIFNLAGQVSHNDSINDPFLDAEINYLGHLNVLENIRKYNNKATVLHAGSRLQFGSIEKIPVNEKHPLKPKTPYALNKTAAENMYLFYFDMYRIPCVMFRIANPYGPRSQMKHSKYSMVNWFIRQAMDNQTIRVFGDGEQIRDYIYVDDLAEAFINCAVNESCFGEVYNVGSGVGTKFKDMVNYLVSLIGQGKIEFVPWPDNYINVETGDYITDIKKICSDTKWIPCTDFKHGVLATYQYYSKYAEHYWQSNFEGLNNLSH